MIVFANALIGLYSGEVNRTTSGYCWRPLSRFKLRLKEAPKTSVTVKNTPATNSKDLARFAQITCSGVSPASQARSSMKMHSGEGRRLNAFGLDGMGKV